MSKKQKRPSTAHQSYRYHLFLFCKQKQFVHGGHRGKVCDFNWNPNNTEDLLIASTEEETNNIHVWSMAKYIYTGNF